MRFISSATSLSERENIGAEWTDTRYGVRFGACLQSFVDCHWWDLGFRIVQGVR